MKSLARPRWIILFVYGISRPHTISGFAVINIWTHDLHEYASNDDEYPLAFQILLERGTTTVLYVLTLSMKSRRRMPLPRV